jgi:PAS domain S-box-containing protein
MSAFQFLWLENNPYFVEVAQATLRAGGIDCEVVRVDSRVNFITALETNAFDLILSNYALPDFDGMAVLEVAHHLHPDIPLLFVSASVGEERAIAAFAAGAAGFVLQHQLEQLLPCVQRALRKAEERHNRKRTELLQVEQQRLLELIATGCPLEECLAAVCASLSRLNPRVRACFLLTDAQRLTFSHSITPDFPLYLNQKLKGLSILCIGTYGEAVYRGQPISCADIANDDRWSPQWRELCVAHGVLACHSQPIIGLEGRAFGSLMLCLDEARMPTEWEYQLANFGTHVASIVFERDRTNLAFGESKAKYRSLFESIDEGFCICEMLFDENGEPQDYRFLEVNPIFERLTGLQQPTGKTARDLVPNLEIFWVEMYGSVVQTGKPIRFEQKSVAMNRWFDVNAFPISDAHNHEFGILFTNITERKQAEVALRESQALFEAFMRYLPATAYIKDEDGRYMYVNPLNERLCDRPLVDWLGKTDFELFTQAQAQQWRHHDLAALAAGEAIEIEENFTQPDGENYFMSLKFPIAHPSGRQLLGGMSLDVTERRQAEIALQQSEEQLRLASAAANLGLWHWNMQNDRLVWTDQCKALFGLPPDIEMSYQVFLDALHPEDRQRIDAMRPVLENGQLSHHEIEYRTVWPDGTVRWLMARGSATYDADRKPISSMGVIFDITDRKQVEAALRESEERARLAIQVAHLGTWCYDPSTDLVELDERMRKIWGEADDTIAIPLPKILERIHPDDRQRVANVVGAALDPNGLGTYEIDYRIVWDNGRERWLSANGQAQFEGEGKSRRVIGFIGTALDITDRKQVEAEREQLLQREQVARAEAERANRIKDEFLAVLSHELRSPLNPILGWTRLLQTGKLDPPRQREALATIERNAQLQTQLIEDLLDISRIIQGKLSLTAACVSLTFVITAAVETVRLAAEAKNIAIVLDLSRITASVLGDATRLQQVVWNLLTNAIKFTPNGGQITVELRQIDQLAQIRVIDTGKGISPSFLPHVFEYFRQADSTTTRKFGGLGLGLAIVRQIVEMHGGTVKAESLGENQGATFTIQLPVIQQTISTTSESPQAKSENTEAPLSNLQILVVDDDDDTREFQAFLLQQSGARVIAVASGLEALQVLEQSIPDLLLSDVGMPEMDGYMLIQQIRSRPSDRGGTIRAIAVSAYAMDFDQQKALQSGFQAHLTKPVESEKLIKTIINLLHRN